MTFSTQAELLAWCEADREHLLSSFSVDRPVSCPAQVIDGVIEDVLFRTLVPWPLPGKQLGWCDYERHRILINSRMKDITLPNTNLDGLLHSTKAHELAHVRLPHHEPELRAHRKKKMAALPPCEADLEASTRRESEADFYAGIFLVPTHSLWQTPEAAELTEAIERQHRLSSETLWRITVDLAQRFHVTGSLMATRLSHVGLVVKMPTRELALPDIRPAELHPHCPNPRL